MRWLGGSALLRLSANMVQSIFDFNSLCRFGRSNFNIYEYVGATGTAVGIFRVPMVHRVGTGCGVAPLFHVIP